MISYRTRYDYAMIFYTFGIWAYKVLTLSSILLLQKKVVIVPFVASIKLYKFIILFWRNNLINITFFFPALPIGQTSMQSSSSLADELNAATGSNSNRPHLVLRKCHSRLRHEDSSPDSERMATDSGHSTAHSPENGPKSVSPIPCNTLQNTDSVSPSSTPGDFFSFFGKLAYWKYHFLKNIIW